MQSHELLKDVFQKCSPKEIASATGLSLSMVYKWAEPNSGEGASGATNPLDRMEMLIKCSNDVRLVQWLCERAGGFFIKNKTADHPHPYPLIPATNEVVQEFADLLAVIASSAGDNHISKQEAREIRSKWEELKSVTEAFVRCCENEDFTTMAKAPEVQKKSGK